MIRIAATLELIGQEDFMVRAQCDGCLVRERGQAIEVQTASV